MSEPLMDHPLVTAIARELFDDVANDEHGQLCPIWARRADHPAWTDCDCWVFRRVRRHAEIALSAPAVRAALSEPVALPGETWAAFRGRTRPPGGPKYGGLVVELLTQAMDNVDPPIDGDDSDEDRAEHRDYARAIAAEYERLGRE